MCGFTGFWDKNLSFSKEHLETIAEKMADKIDHRGPDSWGVWVDEKTGMALGHRRLSIVDLSPAGHQPMISNSGMVLAYNGEIYNTEELRKELIQQGYTFQGHSDTEVILKACEAFGVENTCKKLIGMFSFALWDGKAQALYLVRDRLGIKPLYWGFHHGVLFFGSQLKSFGPHPKWQPELDRNALVSYFRFNYVPTPISIFKGIHKLSPGTILKFNKDHHSQEIRFWDFQKVVESGFEKRASIKSDTERVEALDILLKDAVKRRMVADVPLGAFLSGGIDSSTVVALMQSQSTRPIKTFSIGYNEQSYNEADYAKKVAQHLGTEHNELYLNPSEIFKVIPTMPEWFDEPFADSSQIPTYLVSKLAREQVIVALSGDGGDELFAGYSRYFQGQRAWRLMNLFPMWVKYLCSGVIQGLSPKTWDKLGNLIPKKHRPALVADKLYKISNVLLIKEPEIFYKRLVSQWQNPEELVLGEKESLYFPWQNLNKSKLTNMVDYMQVMDTLSYLPDDILAKVDRASMALGLEARVPLLDHRVVEFAWGCPLHQKIRNNQGKWLLRQVLNRYVPNHLIERPKMGFGIPIEHWLRKELSSWAEDLLYDPALKSEQLLNLSIIHRRWQEHKMGKNNWHYSLWGVLMFLAWKKNWGF